MWGIIGWLAGQIMRGRGYGALYNILLGIGGGIVGGIIFRILPLSGLGDLWLIGSVLSGVVGAVALIYIVRLFSQNKQFGS
ncbi:GlsB/YeaQ/YmgE family stress response membrane protein [Anaerolineae bacterium CFX9]|nr:GlsB/YeaQ/YmgE family stress response membrane protein [Anaerolineae bacterium CFX9]